MLYAGAYCLYLFLFSIFLTSKINGCEDLITKTLDSASGMNWVGIKAYTKGTKF